MFPSPCDMLCIGVYGYARVSKAPAYDDAHPRSPRESTSGCFSMDPTYNTSGSLGWSWVVRWLSLNRQSVPLWEELAVRGLPHAPSWLRSAISLYISLAISCCRLDSVRDQASWEVINKARGERVVEATMMAEEADGLQAICHVKHLSLNIHVAPMSIYEFRKWYGSTLCACDL